MFVHINKCFFKKMCADSFQTPPPKAKKATPAKAPVKNGTAAKKAESEDDDDDDDSGKQ